MEGLIIGIFGFIGSGKGTVGDILKDDYEFTQESFAKPLKDAVSAIFGWNRKLLEGNTDKSRKWREERDDFWSDKLGYGIAPRSILQKFGTEVVRSLDPNIWAISLENRLKPKQQYVITDVRFKNEMALIKKLGGYLVKVERHPLPEWYSQFLGCSTVPLNVYMANYQPKIHRSEWDWIDEDHDCSIINDGTLEDLRLKVSSMLEYFYIDQAISKGMLQNET